MYLPKHFEEHDPAVLHELMRAHPLAAVVIQGEHGLEANHLPLLHDAQTGVLRGHVARGNALWRLAGEGIEALVIFQGVQGYVSPNWYPSKQEHGKVVPTWNYEAVHVHGRLCVIDDREWLRAFVTELTRTHETSRPAPWAPWAVSDAPADYLDTMLGAIVGIELTITRIEGKRKLSQNRSAEDRAGVARGLRAEGSEAAQAHGDAVEQASSPRTQHS